MFPAFDILRHFQSSDNILKAVLERELELMAAAAGDPALRMPGETLDDELRLLAGVIFDQYRKRTQFMGKMIGEAMAEPKIAALYYSTFVVQLWPPALHRISASTQNDLGEIRDDIDVEAAAAMFLASLIGSLLTYELFGGKHVETLDEERMLEPDVLDVSATGLKNGFKK